MLRSVLIAVCLLATSAFAAASVTVTPRAPGVVLVAGKQLIFDVGGAKGNVNYRLTDYFGGVTAQGKARTNGDILIPGVKPGWYALNCTDEAGSASVPIGVVMDRGNEPLPADGRVCTDSASAWLIKNEAYRKPYARMLRLAGIPWVRERLSWPDTEHSPGKIDWAQNQTVADTLASEGIRICQIFHHTPGWAASPAPVDGLPKDLRDLYRYMKAAAGHFRRQIQAWEVWNEADIAWPGLGDTFAGFQKAAYLGLKAGNPHALVLQSSFSPVAWLNRPDGAAWLTVESIYENGIGDYFDIFNWHIYSEPPVYPAMLEGYRALMQQHHYAPRQAWLTEAGIALTATEPPDHRVLTPDAQRVQCRFVSRSAVMGLASGTEKYFWFVMPDYMEGPNQFGLLRADLAPYPGFVALSAAANILGRSQYMGQYKPQGQETIAQAFKTPDGNVLAAWSDKPVEMTLPTQKRAVQVADCFGARTTIAAKNGAVTVKLGPETVYVLDVGQAVMSNVVNTFPPREQRLPVNKPSGTVIVGHCDLPIDRKGECVYNLALDGGQAKPFTYTVEVYCFDENAGVSGTIGVLAPTGWSVDEPKREVKLGPMGREVLTFKVTPVTGGGVVRISAHGKFGSPPVSPTVSRIN